MITFLRLFYPFAPHITEELHELLGNDKSLQQQSWPQYDESKVIDDVLQVIVQINGKTKGKLQVAAGTSEEEIKIQALALDAVKSILGDSEPKKVVIVPGRLVNLVV
jgi:leucyl-tRNA synthetase